MRKRIVSIFLCMMMCLSLLPATVFAEEETGFSFEMPKTDVNIVTTFEMPVLSDAVKLCTGVAITASEAYTERSSAIDAIKNVGYLYTVQKYNSDYNDLNYQAGGHYIYMGSKYESDISPDMDNCVTGLLVAKNCHPKEISYLGKTYYPAPYYYDSNGDMNQGAGGPYLYLYYTTDKADEGAPIITDIMLYGSADDFFEKKGYKSVPGYSSYEDAEGSHTFITEKQNLNEGTSSNFDIYPYVKYHTHNLKTKYNEYEHWRYCTECPYIEKPQNHVYKDFITLENGYQHHTSCNCGFSGDKPHGDKNNDNICDSCKVSLEVTLNGYLCETFKKAWDNAISSNEDAHIALRKNISLSNVMNPLMNGYKITLSGRGYTILSDFGHPFQVNNGTLAIDSNVKFTGGEFDHLFQANSENAEIILQSGNIQIENPKKYVDSYGVIGAYEGAKVTLSKGNITINDPLFQMDGIQIDGQNSSLTTDNVTITGAKNAINVLDAQKVEIKGGTYEGDACALSLRGEAKANVTGGTFRSNNSCAISVETGSVNDILPSDYFYFLEESGNRFQPEDGAKTIEENGSVFNKAYSVNVKTIGNGTAKSDKQRANAGDKITLTEEAESENHFKEWKSDDVIIASDGTFTMPEKNVTITAVFEENEGVTYLDGGGVKSSVKDYQMLTEDTTELSQGWYVIDGNVTLTSRLEVKGYVHLILKDGCNLEAKEGIHVGKFDFLSIYGQSEDASGTLKATTTVYNNAAIGGNEAEDGGDIYINSGNVKAIGLYGAGIGGGAGNSQNIYDGGWGYIYIYGGNVEAKSNYGAGIGGGYNYGRGVVSIDGGTVDAVCEYYGAAIGGGMYGDGTVTINGGNVKATGKNYAAGIGSYASGHGTGKITVTGGTIDAISKMTDAFSSGEDGFIKLNPKNEDAIDVLIKNNMPILNSPFSSETNITKELYGQKEVHIRASEGTGGINEPSRPNTGDDNNQILWLTLFIAGAIILAGSILFIKRKERMF